jgi:hypothetical protein
MAKAGGRRVSGNFHWAERAEDTRRATDYEAITSARVLVTRNTRAKKT